MDISLPLAQKLAVFSGAPQLYSRIMTVVYVSLSKIMAFFACSWGIHLTLFIASLAALARRPAHGYILYALTCVLFMNSTVWTALSYYLAISIVRIPNDPGFIDVVNKIAIPLLFIARLNSNLSDMVVVWRAWVLWSSNKLVKAGLSFCIAVIIGLSLHSRVDIVLRRLTAGNISELAYSCSKYGPAAYASRLSEEGDNYIRAFLFIFPVVLTNVVVTIFVAIRVREYRREIKVHLGRVNRTRVEKFLILLLDSGCVYSGIWVAYFAIDIAYSIKPPSVVYTSWSGPSNITGALLPVTSGVYPTIIIIISVLQASPTIHIPTPEISPSTVADRDHAVSVNLPLNRDTSVRRVRNATSCVPDGIEMSNIGAVKPSPPFCE